MVTNGSWSQIHPDLQDDFQVASDVHDSACKFFDIRGSISFTHPILLFFDTFICSKRPGFSLSQFHGK